MHYGAAAVSRVAWELNKWCSSRNYSSWGVQIVQYGAAAVSTVAGELNKWCSSCNYSSWGVQIVNYQLLGSSISVAAAVIIVDG